jgi:hypothetical protein
MTDNALETAHNPAAPQDERQDAMRIAQQAAMPSSVPNMNELVRYVQQQYEEEQFAKSLAKPKVIPFPSRAVKSNDNGMQSVFLDDFRINIQGEWYERPSVFTFDTMRYMVDQTPVLSAVIMTRQRQVRRFCRVIEGDKGPGFKIALRDPTAKIGTQEQKDIQLLQGFMTNCGWETNPRQRMRLRRDNFSNFMAKHVRDSLTMDSAPIETEFKRDRSRGMDGFYAVDGATIRLCTELGYQGDDEIFALQVVDGQIRTAYTFDDLIYVPRNPRSDVVCGGYGMSETELLVRTVTGFLNAMTYNLKYFDSNAIPKGMLHLSGDYSQDDLSAFKRYWNAMVKGINNAWTLPVMVSKNQESKASFENFGIDVNEIMFAKWMTFLTSIICSIYGMAPDEINFESFTAGTSSLSGSDTEEKLINSKDKGLRTLLAHLEDELSDYVVADFSDKYCFRFTGLDEKSPDQQWTEEQAVSTVNEARKARNMDPLDWGDCPLNPSLISAYQQANQPDDDYGDPSAFGGGGFGGDDDQTDENGKPPAPGTKQNDEEPADKGQMAKSFGLPVFRVDP